MTLRRIALAALPLLLAACGAADGGNEAAAGAAEPPAAPADARLIEERGNLLEFAYGWPAEAAAQPELAALLERLAGEARQAAMREAEEDHGLRGAGDSVFAHSYRRAWQAAGRTPRLLSLSAEVSTFTGGAHPNLTYDGLLWDRQADAAVTLGDLVTNAALPPVPIDEYCATLDTQREEKRGEPVGPGAPDDWMTACPALGEQVLVPADTDGNGRFDRLRVLIPPYEAGPYAEGSYVIELPFDPAWRRALRPEYAESFES